MIYCSAAYKRLIIDCEGSIKRCYSRKNPIGHIRNFDFLSFISDKENFLCNNKDCTVCDQNNNIKTSDFSKIEKHPSPTFVQISSIFYCNRFCPYCRHSDATRNNPFPVIPIRNFVSFINKFPIPVVCEMVGGEPTLKNDVEYIMESEKAIDIAFLTNALQPEKIKQIIRKAEENKKKVTFIPTMHPYAIGFNLDIFWESIISMTMSKYVKIRAVQLIDYKCEEYVDKVSETCSALGVPFALKPLDCTLASSRFDWNYFHNRVSSLKTQKKQFNKINKKKTFTSLL